MALRDHESTLEQIYGQLVSAIDGANRISNSGDITNPTTLSELATAITNLTTTRDKVLKVLKRLQLLDATSDASVANASIAQLTADIAALP